ncbi:rhodanese-like domain-containing protein [Pontivivens ytuae]|uniref:Rhodanese-like domain-containing protein n=1 Tax=Pontivivens ytuae TaxID=2789856 RepID=A0A7S9LQV5_9RHOB|nr:rhodanese-like domain-containing protein [Pontivivens ytuae]QPH53624.1 rhodanese-like domain-containing protein [Pontivivens ytuae]
MYRYLIPALVIALPASAEVEMMSPQEVRAASLAGDVVLIDVRRPDEWAATGIADVAVPLDMTADGFSERLAALRAENADKRVAIICRSGRRSARLAGELENAGWDNLIDVEGGTLAWIEDGLPITTAE